MFCVIRLFSLNKIKAMILETQNQCLTFLSLRESPFPTRIRQWCRGICVGFLPMVLSPIGFSRFMTETFRFLLPSSRECYFSKLKKRFRIWIWDPGEYGSDSKEYWIRNRYWPNFTHFMSDEEEIGRGKLDFPDWVVVYLGLQWRISHQREPLKEAPSFLILMQGQDPRLWRSRRLWAIMERMMRLFYSYWLWYFLFIYFARHLFCYGSFAGICKCFGYRRHDSLPLQATYQSNCLIRVMRRAFGSFIYMMIAYYKYMKRGLNRFYLLPFAGKQGYFQFFIEIEFQFPLFVSRVVFDWFHVSCIM